MTQQYSTYRQQKVRPGITSPVLGENNDCGQLTAQTLVSEDNTKHADNILALKGTKASGLVSTHRSRNQPTWGKGKHSSGS